MRMLLKLGWNTYLIGAKANSETLSALFDEFKLVSYTYQNGNNYYIVDNKNICPEITLVREDELFWDNHVADNTVAELILEKRKLVQELEEIKRDKIILQGKIDKLENTED